jgi:hypothetical protein
MAARHECRVLAPARSCDFRVIADGDGAIHLSKCKIVFTPMRTSDWKGDLHCDKRE